VTSSTDGDQLIFETQVYFGDLDPQAARVELFADGLGGSAPEHVEMKRLEQLVGAINGYAYRAAVPAIRSADDYTPRVVAHYDGIATPLEEARILWQR